MTDREDHGVDLVVAQRLALFGGFQLGGKLENALVPAHFAHQDFHGAALTGTGVADVDTLALEVAEILDPCICSGDDGKGFRMNREHGPQVFICAGVLELGGTVIGMILPIRLGDAEIEFAGLDGVNVVYRATRGFDRAADVVILAAPVDQSADRAAGRIVDAGHTAGADGNELLLRNGSTAGGNAVCPCRDDGGGQTDHEFFHI